MIMHCFRIYDVLHTSYDRVIGAKQETNEDELALNPWIEEEARLYRDGFTSMEMLNNSIGDIDESVEDLNCERIDHLPIHTRTDTT